MRIESIALALLLACASASSALAGVTAPVIVGVYYEQNGNNFCGASSSSSSSGAAGVSACRIDFTAPPAGKLLTVSHVSCSLVGDTGPLYDLYLTVTKSGIDGRTQRLDPTLKTQSGPFYFYLLSEDTQFLVASGPSLVMNITTNGGLTMDCQIVGTLSNKT